MSYALLTMIGREHRDFDGKLRLNEPMSKHTSWRIGGPADRFYIPTGLKDLSAFLKWLPENDPIYWIGLGTNILVRDAGIRGTVIFTYGKLRKLESLEANRIYAEAGTPCAHVARFASAQGLAGAEFFAGIPGTIGGALAMNAGAFDGETWDIVNSAVTIDRSGNFHKRTADDYRISYRSVVGLAQEWFVSTELVLKEGDIEHSQAKIKGLLMQRTKTQPINIPNCGSVFRNPEANYAAKLIEACGLKGKRVGGARISEKHANFILNTGKATANDIETLIHLVVERVNKLQGIRLRPEVRIIGERTR